MIQGVALLGALGLYFWIVFGQLSRRFERQADVFGSKVVSCDLADCPPHNDLDHELSPPPEARRGTPALPGGDSDLRRRPGERRAVQRAGSHGPVVAARQHRHRIAFLEGLERRPERESDFQRSVRRLRIGLGVVLVLAILFSFVAQLWIAGELLRGECGG